MVFLCEPSRGIENVLQKSRHTDQFLYPSRPLSNKLLLVGTKASFRLQAAHIFYFRIGEA